MKRLTITVEEYIKLGGDISKLELSPLRTTYTDSNNGKNIRSISIRPIREYTYPSKSTTQLYTVEFVDSKIHTYAGSWIETSIDFILDPKYR